MTLFEGKDGGLYSFSDLPEEAFPVTITAYQDGKEIWKRVIQPYVFTQIPGSSSDVRLNVLFGNGDEIWAGPLTEEEARGYIDEEVGKGEDDRA